MVKSTASVVTWSLLIFFLIKGGGLGSFYGAQGRRVGYKGVLKGSSWFRLTSLGYISFFLLGKSLPVMLNNA